MKVEISWSFAKGSKIQNERTYPGASATEGSKIQNERSRAGAIVTSKLKNANMQQVATKSEIVLKAGLSGSFAHCRKKKLMSLLTIVVKRD